MSGGESFGDGEAESWTRAVDDEKRLEVRRGGGHSFEVES